MDNVFQDLRSAVRSLRKTPWFTLAVALTLAIAIGANTLVFSVVNAVLLQPMAYPGPESAWSWLCRRDARATPTGIAPHGSGLARASPYADGHRGVPEEQCDADGFGRADIADRLPGFRELVCGPRCSRRGWPGVFAE